MVIWRTPPIQSSNERDLDQIAIAGDHEAIVRQRAFAAAGVNTNSGEDAARVSLLRKVAERAFVYEPATAVAFSARGYEVPRPPKPQRRLTIGSALAELLEMSEREPRILTPVPALRRLGAAADAEILAAVVTQIRRRPWQRWRAEPLLFLVAPLAGFRAKEIELGVRGRFLGFENPALAESLLSPRKRVETSEPFKNGKAATNAIAAAMHQNEARKADQRFYEYLAYGPAWVLYLILLALYVLLVLPLVVMAKYIERSIDRRQPRGSSA